jgi:nucleobase:cation symporter-1, NCS1 family
VTTTVDAGHNEQLRRFVEKHHIDMIPVNARYGKAWHQAAFWAGANWNVFNVVLGGALVAFVGLTFYWAVIVIAAGTLAGALFVALHATQGPRLGVPQTIQTRGQFGFYGAAFLFPAVLLLNVGFLAAQYVIQAQSAQGVISALTVPEWILVLAVPAVLIGIFGYRWIHRVMQATNIIVGVSMIVMLVQALRYGSLPAKETTMHAPTPGVFLAGAALLVIDMLSWAPFVSDYTRYLPVNTNGRRLFWSIYSGNVVSTIVACTIGAYVTALLPSLASPVDAIGKVSGKWALIILAVSLVGSDTLNAYTGAFQVLAFANMWRRFKSASIALRVVPFVCVMATGVLIAIYGSANFLANLSNLLNVLLMIFIPWSAVNLADYFLVRQGNYDVASFFIPDGTYGKVAWRGVVAYVAGLVAEWPFVSQTWLKGPLVNSLGGADISWIVGFFVAGVVYLALVVGASDPGRRGRARQVPVTARSR